MEEGIETFPSVPVDTPSLATLAGSSDQTRMLRHFFPSLVKSKLAGKLVPELSAVLVHGNLHGWLIHLNHTLPCSPPPPKQEPKVAVWFCTENS